MQTPTKGGGSNELTKKQATHNCTRKTADTLKTCVSMKGEYRQESRQH